jgi:hypothetical protein
MQKDNVLFLKKNGSIRVISITRLEHIAALPPMTYQRSSLLRPFLPGLNRKMEYSSWSRLRT